MIKNCAKIIQWDSEKSGRHLCSKNIVFYCWKQKCHLLRCKPSSFFPVSITVICFYIFRNIFSMMNYAVVFNYPLVSASSGFYGDTQPKQEQHLVAISLQSGYIFPYQNQLRKFSRRANLSSEHLYSKQQNGFCNGVPNIL